MSDSVANLISPFPSLSHPLASPPSKKVVERGPLAWTSSFWITLQKEFHRPNVPDALMEVDYLFRAMTRKKNNIVRVEKGGAAYWDTIDANDLARWKLGMTVWGWGDKNALVWNDDFDRDLLRSSIRLYALHQDGPITRAMTKGAMRRRAMLDKLLEKGMTAPRWRMLKMEETTLKERIAYLEGLSHDEMHRLGPEIRGMFNAYREMMWKHKASGRVYRWLLRKGTVSLASVSDWLQAWQYEWAIEPPPATE